MRSPSSYNKFALLHMQPRRPPRPQPWRPAKEEKKKAHFLPSFVMSDATEGRQRRTQVFGREKRPGKKRLRLPRNAFRLRVTTEMSEEARREGKALTREILPSSVIVVVFFFVVLFNLRESCERKRKLPLLLGESVGVADEAVLSLPPRTSGERSRGKRRCLEWKRRIFPHQLFFFAGRNLEIGIGFDGINRFRRQFPRICIFFSPLKVGRRRRAEEERSRSRNRQRRRRRRRLRRNRNQLLPTVHLRSALFIV